jgi:hypothetical protein
LGRVFRFITNRVVTENSKTIAMKKVRIGKEEQNRTFFFNRITFEASYDVPEDIIQERLELQELNSMQNYHHHHHLYYEHQFTANLNDNNNGFNYNSINNNTKTSTSRFQTKLDIKNDPYATKNSKY